MPKYLLQVSYTLDGVRGVVAKGGTARKAAAQAAAESVGGTLDVFYFVFGETDVVTIGDLPNNEAAAALALAVTAGGGRPFARPCSWPLTKSTRQPAIKSTTRLRASNKAA